MKIVEKENGEFEIVGTPEEWAEAERRCRMAGRMDNRANREYTRVYGRY